MQVIYNILVPPFLKRADRWLLNNNPVVWRTNAIYVFYYGILLGIFAFAAGLLYPIDPQHLVVDPIIPIEMGYDNYHLWAVFLVGLGIVYWGYRQYQFGFPFTKVRDSVVTILVYAGCFYLLLGFTTPAFRWGTIVKTACFWVDDVQLKCLEDSGIYPYGIFLSEEDSAYSDTLSKDFFKKREMVLDTIVQYEEEFLQHLYTTDTIYWNKKLKVLSDLRYLSYLSDRSYRSYLPDRSYLSYMSYLFYLSYHSDRSAVSDLSYLSYRHDQSYLPDMSYLSYLTYRFNRSLMYMQSWSDRSDQSDLVLLFRYAQTNQITAFPCEHMGQYSNLSQNHLMKFSDTSITIPRPALPYIVENTVRTVKNARLYLQKKAYMRHWALISRFVFLPALLCFLCLFLSIRLFSVVLLGCLAGALIIGFQLEDKQSESTSMMISNMVYLFIPVASMVWLCISAASQKRLPGFGLVVNGLLTGVLIILFSALSGIFRSKLEFVHIQHFQPPYNLAFYGVQVIGLIGALLTTYVKTLPKA